MPGGAAWGRTRARLKIAPARLPTCGEMAVCGIIPPALALATGFAVRGILEMDWRLIGAVAGILALGGATAAAVSFVYHSPSNVLVSRKVPPSPTLIAAAP